MELPSVDGSLRYRVLLVSGRLGAVIALAAPLTSVEATHVRRWSGCCC